MFNDSNSKSEAFPLEKSNLEEDEIMSILHKNYEWMIVVAKRIVVCPSLSEDVVQDALINALKGFETFANRSSIKTWLRRITINQAISKLRQLNRLSEVSIDGLLKTVDTSDYRAAEIHRESKSPDMFLEQTDTLQLINDSFVKLSKSYSKMIMLRDIQGYTTTEVADLLGISETNVKVRLHRARAALKKLLSHDLLINSSM